MNIFSKTLIGYLKQQCEAVLSGGAGDKEVRLFVESLPITHAKTVFEEMESFLLQEGNVDYHLKIANGLWLDWKDGASDSPHELNIIDSKGWVDHEDKLTFYRNQPCPPGKDALVIILIGLDHASDKGGLADFHVVKEDMLWNQVLLGSYESWVDQLISSCGLPSDEKISKTLVVVLNTIYKNRHRSLIELSDFFSIHVVPHKSYFVTSNDLIQHIFERIPAWGIPPFFKIPSSDNKIVTMLNDAIRFIKHQMFNTKAERKKATSKIEAARSSGLIDIPETLNNENIYSSLDDFIETVVGFIKNGDRESEQKLLKTDISQVLEVIKKRGKKGKGKIRVTRLNGPSISTFIEAVWLTLKDFKRSCRNDWAPSLITSVDITITGFKHNITADIDDLIGGSDTAREILEGCLGGLDKVFFDCIDVKSDSDSDSRDKDIPVKLSFGIDEEGIRYTSTRAKPGVEFEVNVKSIYDTYSQTNYFIWALDDNSEENVRFQCANLILRVLKSHHQQIIPTFKINRTYTELFFAGDVEEANRLVREGLVDLEVDDILRGAEQTDFDDRLIAMVTDLSSRYESYLKCFVKKGYYEANIEKSHNVIAAYKELTALLLCGDYEGSTELLKRFYKAFLVVNKDSSPGDSFVSSAIALGISPFVAELSYAREAYLIKHFPEIASELLERGSASSELNYDRLMGLIEIRRPLAAIVKDNDHRLSTRIRSFGLVHCFGDPPSTELSLVSQSIMREQNSEDDESLSSIIKPNDESKIIQRTLADYQKLHPYANDQLQILIVNATDLKTTLSGVHHFLVNYLKDQSEESPPFQLFLKVYTSSSFPIAIANQLSVWRDHWLQVEGSGRKCQIRVGHRYAPQSKNVLDFLEKERSGFDVTFFLKFMMSQQGGDEVEPVAPFDFNFSPSNIDKFPISEYPRPVSKYDLNHRQTLLSNRRLRTQTCHVELSARLKHPHNPKNQNYLVFGQVDMSDWEKVIAALHKHTQWLACIDPYIDKLLLDRVGVNKDTERKIVGFNSGLGLYGELNLTISTEADTFSRLITLMRERLSVLFPAWDKSKCSLVAQSVIAESQEITGLSLVKAIGNSEHVRDVVAYAMVKKAFANSPNAIMTQIVPIDSVQHWFQGADNNQRPDLLRFEVFLEGSIVKIKASVIECKLALANEKHLNKAIQQTKAGLARLTHIFKPNTEDEDSATFDRRYWWAQLQRAIATRSLVSFSPEVSYKVNAAFEHLVEGYFEIEWQAAVVTLWSDQKDLKSEPTKLNPPITDFAEGNVSEGSFHIYHFEYGYDDVAELFTESSAPSVEIPDVCLKYPCSQCSSSGVQQATVATEPVAVEPVAVEPVAVEPVAVEPVAVEPVAVEPVAVELGGDVPERLLLGNDRNDQPIYWEYGHENLNNRHMLIFGASGSGKTYAIQCLLAELAIRQQNSLIVDYTDGFLPNQVEYAFTQIAKPKTHLVIHEPLPVNPFRKQTKTIEGFGSIEESEFNVATRVANVFSSVFDTVGQQQFAALIRAIEVGLSLNQSFDLDSLIEYLEEEGDVGITLSNKITPLIKMKPFLEIANSGWKQMLESDNSKVHILQLAGIPREFQRIISEFVLWDIFDYASSNGSKDNPLPIVLDEIQNLDHRSDSPLDKLLREGRKFGISLILATQTLSNFGSEERDRLFQASHKLFFAPADTEVKRYADILKDNVPGTNRDDWVQRLKSLQKGECLSLGPVASSDGRLRDRVVPLKISALESRMKA